MSALNIARLATHHAYGGSNMGKTLMGFAIALSAAQIEQIGAQIRGHRLKTQFDRSLSG
ncbi:hypothetical protein ABEH28_11945 [Pseudomonas sp. Ps21-P2]|uniref:hypothetical protein n=1 Tax=Pseudomonas sp. Ps21-P2 TaxID=3080331 RepID=UPI003207E842